MKTGSWYSLLGPKTCHASTGAHSASCKVPRSPSTLPTLCNQAEYFAFFLSWAYFIPSPRGTVSSISSTNFPAVFHSNMSGHSVTPPSSIHLQEPGTWVLETGSTPDFLAGSCDLRLTSSSSPHRLCKLPEHLVMLSSEPALGKCSLASTEVTGLLYS